DRVQVARVHVTAQTRGLEGYRASAAKGVAYLWAFAETQDAELLHQFRHGAGTCPQMPIDIVPNRLEEFPLIQFFGALGSGNTVEVTEAPHPPQLPSVALSLPHRFFPEQVVGL